MAVTLCPLALATGCRRCPIFTVCPLKGVIGDQHGGSAAPAEPEAAPTSGRKPRAAAKRKR